MWENLLPRIQNFDCKFPILREFTGKIKILSTAVISSVGKWKLPAPVLAQPTMPRLGVNFLSHRLYTTSTWREGEVEMGGHVSVCIIVPAVHCGIGSHAARLPCC